MVDYSPAGVAAIEQINRDYVKECADKMGTAFLAGVGTDSAAKDMDTVRQVLGDDRINYLGFSYGTELGTAYLEKFPDRVRTMVLDGAIDPAQNTVDSIIEQMTGFQVAFNDYAADCAKSAGCPLGTDPAHWVDRYHQLVDPLVSKPAPTSDPRGLSYQDAITGTFNALYTPQYWKFLTSGLLGLQRKTDAGDLLMLADEYEGRDPYGHYSNGQDAFNAVRCVDGPTPTDSATWADIDRRTRELAPFQAYGQFTGLAPATSARSGRCRPPRHRIPPRPRRPAASSSSPRRTTRPRRTRRGQPGARTQRTVDHLRRHSAHRRVQREPVRRHSDRELLRRPDGAGQSALLMTTAAAP